MCTIRVAAIAGALPGDDGALGALAAGRSCLEPIAHPHVAVGSRLSASSSERVEDPRVPSHMLDVLTPSSQHALVAGLNALEQAGLVSSATGWTLAPALQPDTGVIFASSFEHHERAVTSMSEHIRRAEADRIRSIIEAKGLDVEIADADVGSHRKAALQVVLNANVQLAQLVRARGPNMFTSNSCASTTAALKLACNHLQLGDASRMVVIAADTPLSKMNENIVSSFVQMRAATAAATLQEAVLPFSRGRNGFVFGEGAIGIVLERADDGGVGSVGSAPRARVELISSRLANSAHHGTRLDASHLAEIIGRCVHDACAKRGVALADFAARCMYVAHETFTGSCANVEIDALERVFGRALLQRVLITSSKCLTGHAMGACMEDAFSVLCLQRRAIPRIQVPDVAPEFADLRIGERLDEAPIDFAIHTALGMGSHVAVVVYGSLADEGCVEGDVEGDAPIPDFASPL